MGRSLDQKLLTACKGELGGSEGKEKKISLPDTVSTEAKVGLFSKDGKRKEAWRGAGEKRKKQNIEPSRGRKNERLRGVPKGARNYVRKVEEGKKKKQEAAVFNSAAMEGEG